MILMDRIVLWRRRDQNMITAQLVSTLASSRHNHGLRPTRKMHQANSVRLPNEAVKAIFAFMTRNELNFYSLLNRYHIKRQ